MRKRRPFESWSWTKSTDQRAFGFASTRIGARTPVARGPSLADGQTLLAVKPLRLLSIQNVTFGAQKNVQPAITEPALLGRQLPQAVAQGVVSRSPRSVADGLAIGLYQAARPALAHLAGGYETGDSLALGGGRQNFFVTRSFSAALSSIASARRRFSLAFSSSSC